MKRRNMESYREGQYFYAPHRRQWGVWKAGKVVNGIQQSEFISDFTTKIQAKSFANKMNGYSLNN